MGDAQVAVLIGLAIGVMSSIVGAIVSYIIYLRQGEEQTTGPVGVMLVVSGTLVFIGFIVIVLALYIGQLVQAILTGVGVFIGFGLTFGLLVMLWTRYQSNKESE